MKKLFMFSSIFIMVFLFGCTSSETKQNEQQTLKNDIISDTTETIVQPQKDTTTMKQQKFIISTPYGEMSGILYNETPFHRDNFVQLVNQGYYNDLLFHRVISDFMIQGGDPDSKNAPKGKQLGQGGPGYTINAEFNKNFIHKKGALAAARMGDQMNPQKKSSGSQFYIVQGKSMSINEITQMEQYNGLAYTHEQIKIYQSIGGTPFLDGQYTVFGEIVQGLDVIDKIAAVEKDKADRPIQDIKMTIKIVD